MSPKYIFSNSVSQIEAITRGFLCQKAIFKHLAILTGKHLYWSLFLIKLQTFRLATLLRRDPTQVFSCEYYQIFKKLYFEEHRRTAASVSNVFPFALVIIS